MMLRGPAVSLTEYEDNILFDLDDPDFAAGERPRATSPKPQPTLGAGLRRGSRGSCGSSASLVTLELPHREKPLSECSSCTSFDGDLAYLSIESLRSHLNSCFTCGVSWVEEHVSLDCPECGGYSLERPCPSCNGRCQSKWKRDLATSHASGRAQWEGCCSMDCSSSPLPSPTAARLLLRSLAEMANDASEPNSPCEKRS